MFRNTIIAAIVPATLAIRFRPPADSVPWQIPVNVPAFMKEDGYPRDYFVPDFGVDQGILDTQQAIKVAEK